MVVNAFVKIWGERVGAISWDEHQQLGIFEYDKNFKKLEWDIAPIKMSIRSNQNIFSFPELRSHRSSPFNTFKGLPGLLADVLPDRYGNQVINAWLARNGRPLNSLNPVEVLCLIGRRGMGALEFEPSYFTDNTGAFDLELSSLVQIAQDILSERNTLSVNMVHNEIQAMKTILRIGTSAGGARPKAIIAYNSNTGEVKSGQGEIPPGFEHWMIKLDGVQDQYFGNTGGYGRVEMAYHLMARDCGIDMMECRLLEENERAHFMTRRFDRNENSEKYHIQSFCALQHFDFNEVNSFSYEQLFQTMRILHLDYREAEQMFRRMVFNVVARNCDDHTKNFSFRMKKGGTWHLSPAYDICHAYRPDSPWVSQHALSVNGKRKNILREDLLTMAQSVGIKKAKGIIEQIQDVVLNWEIYAQKCKVKDDLVESIGMTHLELRN